MITFPAVLEKDSLEYVSLGVCVRALPGPLAVQKVACVCASVGPSALAFSLKSSTKHSSDQFFSLYKWWASREE
jgi:hypothetical protein